MYIPKINLANDKEEILTFMKRFSFATIITSENNFPNATHLPFLVSINDKKVILTSHFAKANPHWKDIENKKVLVIFAEPHAYISPKNYDTALNVPTWNYLAVHAYGNGKLIRDIQKTIKVLEKTIDNFEPDYKSQWDKMPNDYKLKLTKGIVAFEIVIDDLQAKKKLSQNRSDLEKHKIIDSLSKSTDTNEKLIAEYMKFER